MNHTCINTAPNPPAVMQPCEACQAEFAASPAAFMARRNPEYAIGECVATLLALTPEQRAQVIAELPESKPTAWQRLSAWLVAEPGRSYDRSTDGHFAAHGHGLFWLIDDEAVFAKGEGPTLDAALAKAMEKL